MIPGVSAVELAAPSKAGPARRFSGSRPPLVAPRWVARGWEALLPNATDLIQGGSTPGRRPTRTDNCAAHQPTTAGTGYDAGVSAPQRNPPGVPQLGHAARHAVEATWQTEHRHPGSGSASRGTPQRLALGSTAGLRLPMLLLFQLRQQQPQPALVHTRIARRLGLVPRLAGQPGLQRRARQQQAAFRVGRIGLAPAAAPPSPAPVCR